MSSKVKITFLGTGDAANTGGRSHQAILIQSKKCCLLVDCGANTLLRFQQEKINPEHVDAVLFTHFHADHFFGIINFDLSLIFDYPRERDIIYAGPVGTEKQYYMLAQLAYPSLYPNDKYKRVFHEYNKSHTYMLGDAKIETVAMKHAPESLAYRITVDEKTIAISGDTEWHDDIITLATGSDVFICESFHYEIPETKIGHMAYKEIEKNVEQINSKKIILLHVGNEVLNNKSRCTIPIVSDGDVIEI